MKTGAAYDRLIFELSSPARVGYSLPEPDVSVEEARATLPAGFARAEPPALPEVSEFDVVRHYSRLSRMNYGVDTHFYPLGSCTMKYNPRLNEDVARLPGFARLHPLTPPAAAQDSDVPIDEYLLQIWPAPPSPAVTLKRTSQQGAYWQEQS